MKLTILLCLLLTSSNAFVFRQQTQNHHQNGVAVVVQQKQPSFVLLAFSSKVEEAANAAADASAAAAKAADYAASAAKAAADAAQKLAAVIAEEAAAAATTSSTPPAVEEPAAPAPVAEPAVAKTKKEEAPAPAAAAAEAPKKEGAGTVSPKLVKQLRDLTGAGMMDCKKALLEENGDMDAAAEFLRKKGLAKADKKATRVAAEGRMAVATNEDGAVLVEVNCETDFVAKDQSFIDYCTTVAQAALSYPAAGESGSVVDDTASFLSSSTGSAGTLEEERQAMVARIGENIQVRRMAKRGTPDTTVGAYVHMNRIGVLVEIEGGTPELASDVAMHVAALNPPFAKPDDVPAEVLEREKKFLSDQALESGKPAGIVEKMVEGRIRKYLEEICLVSQIYVKTNDKTVGKLLEENGAKMVGFTRIEVGEGVEKKEDNFAAEVASMAAVN